MPVNALSARVGLSQPLISWHLRILRLADLIDTRRQGREVICRLRDGGLRGAARGRGTPHRRHRQDRFGDGCAWR